ncbi:MAG: lipopolysaccharide transport periplasmic protein LptA [Proteobacteria bacterium]|nr:lipopolysaccharide transport periplasmic protein LptA [Pseudomonadota bacterium]
MVRSCLISRLLLSAGAALATAAPAAAPATPATTPATTPAATTAPAAAPATAPATAQTPVTAAAPSTQLPIKVDAASSDVDYKTNTVNFRDVVISQGATRVQADRAHATGLTFGNSRWTFSGNVRIDAEQRGSLRSDEAVVEFRDDHIARATISGTPAQFEQAREGAAPPARGRAGQIVYDLNDGTVRLSGDAWLSDGKSEISGPTLVYNIRAQRVQATAAPDGGKRVQITIDPNSGAIIDHSAATPPRGATDPGAKPAPPPSPPPQLPPRS